jgi:uncharacterized protein
MFVILALILSLAQSTATISEPQSIPPSPATVSKLSASELSQLRSKAESGDAAAQLALGRAYQDGNGVKQDDDLAVKWYRSAAEQGNATAQNDLGIMYRTGSGVEKSKEEAVNWYRRAARQGNASAMFNLGAAYYNGDGVEESVFKAYDWFLLGKEAGSTQADDAVQRTAAEIGDRASDDALMDVGEMYEKGNDLLLSTAEAAKWYRKAADRNIPRGMVKLALMLMNGTGVPQDFTQALQLCKAAAKGYSSAQYCVGLFYQQGWGVAADATEAAKWYQKAAERGHGPAEVALAQMYWKGQGVKADPVEAYLWLFNAYTQASQKSAPALADSVLKGMSANDVKRLDKKLRERRLDPKKVRDIMQAAPA